MRSSQGHLNDVCKHSRFESLKRREYSLGNISYLGLFNVNQPVPLFSCLCICSLRVLPLQSDRGLFRDQAFDAAKMCEENNGDHSNPNNGNIHNNGNLE